MRVIRIHTARGRYFVSVLEFTPRSKLADIGSIFDLRGNTLDDISGIRRGMCKLGNVQPYRAFRLLDISGMGLTGHVAVRMEQPRVYPVKPSPDVRAVLAEYD